MVERVTLNEAFTAFTTLMALWALKSHLGSNVGKVMFHMSFYSSSGNYINIYPVCGQ